MAPLAKRWVGVDTSTIMPGKEYMRVWKALYSGDSFKKKLGNALLGVELSGPLAAASFGKRQKIRHLFEKIWALMNVVGAILPLP